MATRDGDSNTLFNAFLIAYGGAGIVSPDGALHLDAKVRAAANPMGWQIALKSPVLLPNRYQGPTPGSRALNIGVSLVEEFRGKGIGSIA